MHVHRNATAIIADGNRPIDMDDDLDLHAVSGQMLIDRVVEHLRDAMVESPLVGTTDVHARFFPDCFQPLQRADLGAIVGFLGRNLIGHKE